MTGPALSRIRSILALTPARLTALAEGVPIDMLDAEPAPGEWSARRTVVHLVATERLIFPVRVKNFLAGEPLVSNTLYRVGDLPDHSAAELAGMFADDRLSSLDLFDTITESDLARGSTHPELGGVRLGELLHEWAGHDLQHLVQIEEALMQPFIRQTGAWRFYFAAHDVERQPVG